MSPFLNFLPTAAGPTIESIQSMVLPTLNANLIATQAKPIKTVRADGEKESTQSNMVA